METLNFVLGALSGLFLAGIFYIFIGVLRMTRKTKGLEDQNSSFKKDIDNLYRKLEEEKEHLYQEIEKRSEEVIKHCDYLTEEINRRGEEATRYVDSRIDKAIETIKKS